MESVYFFSAVLFIFVIDLLEYYVNTLNPEIWLFGLYFSLKNETKIKSSFPIKL